MQGLSQINSLRPPTAPATKKLGPPSVKKRYRLRQNPQELLEILQKQGIFTQERLVLVEFFPRSGASPACWKAHHRENVMKRTRVLIMNLMVGAGIWFWVHSSIFGQESQASAERDSSSQKARMAKDCGEISPKP
jgi:hypothetical protein